MPLAKVMRNRAMPPSRMRGAIAPRRCRVAASASISPPIGTTTSTAARERRPMVQAPSLEFVFEARVTIAPTVDMGETPRGRQRMIPITGGVVEGPNFRGTVLPGGADWKILSPDGATELTAQYVIRAEDGTQIAVVNRALRHAPPEI